jgi:hypothetical protein
MCEWDECSLLFPPGRQTLAGNAKAIKEGNDLAGAPMVDEKFFNTANGVK